MGARLVLEGRGCRRFAFCLEIGRQGPWTRRRRPDQSLISHMPMDSERKLTLLWPIYRVGTHHWNAATTSAGWLHHTVPPL